MTTEEVKLMEELRQGNWYKTRPQIIKDAIEKYPPVQLYRFKESKKECYIISYEEPGNGKSENLTLMVQKTGNGGALAEMGLGSLDTNQVFGVKPDDIEPVNP